LIFSGPRSARRKTVPDRTAASEATKVGLFVYLVSAAVFSIELLGDITGVYLFDISWQVHEVIKLATFMGFVVGSILIWRSYRQLASRNAEIERYLLAAQGEFFAMLELQFDRWELSAAERDVALLTTKGLSVSEIAALRETSPGTIKSQNNSIYRKAGVKSRTQLLCALIDELLIVDTSSGRRDPQTQSPGQAEMTG